MWKYPKAYETLVKYDRSRFNFWTGKTEMGGREINAATPLDTIPIRWDEKSQTLEIGARHGAYPSMAMTRTFDVVWVSEGHGVGASLTKQPDAVVHHNGERVTVAAKPAP